MSTQHKTHEFNENPYPKFFVMMAVSFVVMYAVMYLHTYSLDHIFFSEMRAYMTMLMIAAMAVTMLLMMWKMYQNKKTNFAILGVAIAVFALFIYIERSQVFVADSSWMKSMIPHHSIAVSTSERANIKDVRVRALADDIIKAQRKEIKEMKWLIEDIKTNGEVINSSQLKGRELPSFEGNKK